MKHGFIKVAAVSPLTHVASCEENISEILRGVIDAEAAGASVAVFPELAVCGSSCGDLLYSSTLLDSARNALCRLVAATEDSDIIIIIGFPLVVNDKLYNCAAFCQKGNILGVVPKTILSNSDRRYFSSYTGKTVEIKLGEYTTRFGARQIFRCETLPSFTLGIEIGTEAYALMPPSCGLAAHGAAVIVNPFAAPETVGTEEYRLTALKALSARELCGYVRAESGDGESTTDGVFGGACMILENGRLLAESKALALGNVRMAVSELDLELIAGERRRSDSFTSELDDGYAVSTFTTELRDTVLTRHVSPSPFIPEDESERRLCCEKILTLQAKGLAQRITKAYARKCVVGISGGLDSCLAILVSVKAMELLGRPSTDIIGVTMPCFGTTERTRSNAELLCSELGTEQRSINIGQSVRQHFADIGHSESDHSVVYENAQARERTQVIMDVANMENGLVVGTGDLSELALGWATYNGDHMSMYGVNGGIPKTLIRHVVAYCAQTACDMGRQGLADVLYDILATPVSPELLPADKDGSIAQKTEELVGPYELHDFYIYYMLRYGFSPDKLYRLARLALGDKYSDEILLKWLKNLIRRFFSQQFKRSCLPDGPRIGTVALSPRGAWQMPSDACAADWLRIADSL